MTPLNATDRDALAASPLLSALTPEQIEHFADTCQTVTVRPEQFVFTDGSPADAFFIVLGGLVKIFKLSPRGDEQILHLYGPGESFGEAAMWAGGDFPAHAIALEDSRLLKIGRKTLQADLAASPELAMGMLAGLSAKLREFATLIEQLSLKDVPARLAGVLLEMADASGGGTFRLSQTKRQLAAQLGTAAETLSRALGKLKSADLIDVKGQTITIRDAKGLADLAQG